GSWRGVKIPAGGEGRKRIQSASREPCWAGKHSGTGIRGTRRSGDHRRGLLRQTHPVSCRTRNEPLPHAASNPMVAREGIRPSWLGPLPERRYENEQEGRCGMTEQLTRNLPVLFIGGLGRSGSTVFVLRFWGKAARDGNKARRERE